MFSTYKENANIADMNSNKKFKKVLVVMPGDTSFMPYLSEFRKLGVKSQLFNYRGTVFIEKIIFAFSLLIRMINQPYAKITYEFGQKLINLRLIKVVKKNKPDLVLVIKGENIAASTVLEIRKITRVVNYFSDYMRWFSEEQMKAWLSAYEVTFTGDMWDVETYRKKGFKNLYHVHLPAPPVSNIPKNKKNDLVFVGAYSKEREETFKLLKDLNFKIWGDKKWESSILKNNFMGKWLSNDENLEVFKNSKIVVNFHNDLTGKNRYINLRAFEAAACEALLISDLRKDLPTVFKIGKEIIVYKNKSDLYKKVKYYLNNDDERLKIASAGRKRVLKEHTYKQRIKKMLSLIKG